MAMHWLVRGCVFALLSGVSVAASAEDACPKAGTLGVSRTVEIDTTGGPGFGMEHYKAYDFLQDKEVVLTFDDGPQKYSTEAVLKALADECVKATFFSIGKMALGYPEIIREVSKAGHTVGTHTWSHKAIAKAKTFEEGRAEIERGISGVHRAVGGPIAPFFRFPTLVDTPEAVAYLGKRNIAMFSTDIDSIDYKPQTVDHLVKSVIAKLDKRGKGIILMHDIHKRTAQALPLLLAQMKAKGYKIVHLTAKAPVVTLAEFDETIEKEAKGLPQVGAERPMSSVVKTVGATSPPDDAASGASEPEGMPAPPVEDSAHAPLPAFPAASSPAEKSASPEASPPSSTTSAPGKQSSNEPPSASSSAGTQAAQTTQPTAAPVASSGTAAASPPSMTTASVVRTVSGNGEAEPAAATEPPAKDAAPAAPHKSLMERAKETWKLWFGE
ncbi:MAG: polysaccharide deacetylase family protein [Hyphomicrobium sp.]|uniref:polysaccharide deacetylase family protein n=1 Tax=Hyphomicrobium sp. TaxID=82 RepID=UPI00356942A4